MARHLLTDFELMILLATLRVGDAAYGVPIAAEIEAHRRPPCRRRRGLYGARSARTERHGVFDDRRADAGARRPGEAIFSGDAAGNAGGQGNPARAGRALERCPSTQGRTCMSRGMSTLALWLLGHLAHRNEPLAGDLLEQFRSQAICALALVAAVVGDRPGIVPAAPRSRRAQPHAHRSGCRRVAHVEASSPPRASISSSPVEGVGGLGMMIMGLLLSSVVPDVWWFVVGGIVCGLALGMTLAFRRRTSTDGDRRANPHGTVKRSLCVT